MHAHRFDLEISGTSLVFHCETRRSSVPHHCGQDPPQAFRHPNSPGDSRRHRATDPM